METQPKNPELGNDPETFHPCIWLFACHVSGETRIVVINWSRNTFKRDACTQNLYLGRCILKYTVGNLVSMGH